MPKKSKKTKNQRYYILIVFLLLLLLIFIFLFSESHKKIIFSENNTYYEITQYDIISIPNITSLNVTVFGVKLGDRYDDVILKIGEPDHVVKDYIGRGILNLEYGPSLGNKDLNEIALVIHLENNIVTQINIQNEFNKYLKGKTILNYTNKRELYEKYGLPDVIQGSAFGTFYKYNKKGWMILVNKGVMQAFSLYYPNNITSGKIVNASKYNITFEQNTSESTKENSSQFMKINTQNPDYQDIKKMIVE